MFASACCSQICVLSRLFCVVGFWLVFDGGLDLLFMVGYLVVLDLRLGLLIVLVCFLFVCSYMCLHLKFV